MIVSFLLEETVRDLWVNKEGVDQDNVSVPST